MRPEVDIAEVDAIVDRLGRNAAQVIPVLHAIQRTYRYLPEPALRRVCELTEISPAAIHSVATFFPQFRTTPAGEHMVCVCDGTACHLKGAPAVYDAIAKRLRLAEGEDTDHDGMFTVQKVRCLGCCTLAPAVQIDGVTYGHVSPDSVAGMLEDFRAHAAETGGAKGLSSEPPHSALAEIRIGLGSCCVAGGSERIRGALETVIEKYGINVHVKHVSCVGMCHQTPLLEIIPAGGPAKLYAKVRPEDVESLVLADFPPRTAALRTQRAARHWLERLYGGAEEKPVERCALNPDSGAAAAFLKAQFHIATEHSGEINPLDLQDYLQRDGFSALRRCLDVNGSAAGPGMDPVSVIEEIRRSGLRGRGGAGFPTARKWATVRDAPGTEKYIICNGDEGDPGAFMDRMILESYPYRVIEGMLIASVAVGAHRGIFYIRSEYPLAVERVQKAIACCVEAGILGGHVLGYSHAFDVEVREGAGAFVCGEESAMIASLEGRRPAPRFRPPYPAQQGLDGHPTLVNNVETFATVPWVIRHGAAAFAARGTEASPGTKVFALAGKIQRGGLIEVPMGMTIREIVETIGGGVAQGRTLKAVQIGGPSGGCIPAHLADLPVEYETLTRAGSMMGSGGFVVLDDTDCIVEISRYFLTFTQLESCGKCTPCRVGTRQMLDILERLCAGKGTLADLDRLRQLAKTVKSLSLCGLGKTAPNPVLSALEHFHDEYEAHAHGRCPAHVCKPLITFSITQDCIGCTKCAQHCPSGAIAKRPYAVHEIDTAKCVRCGGCRAVCPVNAVKVD